MKLVQGVALAVNGWLCPGSRVPLECHQKNLGSVHIPTRSPRIGRRISTTPNSGMQTIQSSWASYLLARSPHCCDNHHSARTRIRDLNALFPLELIADDQQVRFSHQLLKRVALYSLHILLSFSPLKFPSPPFSRLWPVSTTSFVTRPSLYGTLTPRHPGVSASSRLGACCLSLSFLLLSTNHLNFHRHGASCG